MRHELGNLFSGKIAIILVDGMAKTKVGALNVSRYLQNNLNYHDFPVSGYSLKVSEHMFLTPDEKNNYRALNESNYVLESLTNSESNFQI